jgi:hypothetical protein
MHSAHSSNSICARTGGEVLHLFNETMRAFPPPRRGACSKGLHEPLPLGQYLVNLGYINHAQLNWALASQRSATVGNLQLGVILVRHSLIAPQPLTAILLRQMLDRLIMATPSRLLIGEYLLVNKLVRISDLHRALQSQIWLAARHHTSVPIGEVLTMHGAISPATLDQALLARDDDSWQPLPMVESAVPSLS